MWRIKLQKIVGNLLDKLRKLYRNGTVIYKFLAVLSRRKFQVASSICLSEQIFYSKQSLGAPVLCQPRSLPTFVIYLLCSIDFSAACVAWAGFFKAGREKSQVRSRVHLLFLFVIIVLRREKDFNSRAWPLKNLIITFCKFKFPFAYNSKINV